MCGIVGAVNWADAETLSRMNKIQAHRGPDDDGVWTSLLQDQTFVGLAARRLSIIDLSRAGHMPMSTSDGALTIVYNGEIYNYRELRLSLEQKGYSFRSETDTEVVLNLYREYGENALSRLNGMFAFGIWDSENRELFLARDHFGIKPLYYACKGDGFAFASEAKSLLELPGFSRRVDPNALDQYLTLLWVPDPLTMFDGILKLPAGHFARFRHGKLSIEQYWDLEFPEANHEYDMDENALARELRDRFAASVKGQLVSDVPVGSFLSSGLDSTSIVAAMKRAGVAVPRTYTITFPQNYLKGEVTLDDPAIAKRTAARFECEHTEILVEPDVVELLPKLIWHMDEPVADPAIVAAYLVCREARGAVTVLLSGTGGDELFGGYRKHAAFSIAGAYQRIPGVIRRQIFEPVVLSLPSLRGTPFKGHVRLAKKMARSASLSPREYYVETCTYLNRQQRAALYCSDFKSELNGSTAEARLQQYFSTVRSADFLNQMLYVDTKAFMASLNLTYNDKMSMASSLEVRVPFLDRQLVEWVAQNVAPQLKINNGTTKYILREAMRPDVSPEVLAQRKAGFGAPADYWLANDLVEMVDDLLSEENIRKRSFFEPSAVKRFVHQQRSGREDWSLQVWQFLTLELWMREFID